MMMKLLQHNITKYERFSENNLCLKKQTGTNLYIYSAGFVDGQKKEKQEQKK